VSWGPEYAAGQTGLACTIAYVAHKGQKRAGLPPEPYFEHVRRVAAAFPPSPEKCVAYLHDVVEDTPVGFDDLNELGVDSDVVRAVALLTHAHGITNDEYAAYVKRLARSPLARAVKVADLADNLGAVNRLLASGQPELAVRLGRRYSAALEILAPQVDDRTRFKPNPGYLVVCPDCWERRPS
jgi:(p)ppGpp synthase/HD superfamily hydrolase